MASGIRKESAQHLGRETTNSFNPVPPPPRPGGGVVPPHFPSTEVAMPVPEHPMYWRTCILASSAVLPLGAVPREENLPPPPKKSILEAYILGLPFGALGFHHLYLGRPGFFLTYFLTFGLLGFGWLVDLFRMPCLVRRVNRQKREQQEELIRLQRVSRQWQQTNCKMIFVAVSRKSLDDAYIMWFPFGILGSHHFYLRNYGMGFLYFFTFGLFGVGWLVDLFRMPSLVRESNKLALNPQQYEKSQCLAQTLAMTPSGIFGAHHFYLGRPAWGMLYMYTGGLMLTGWLADWFRTWNLAKRANAIQQGRVSPHKKYLDDAYILCIPLGFLGFHHFYLRRYGWGLFYLFTLGVFGIGWIIDWFRLPCLVKDANKQILGQGQGIIIATPTSPLLGSTGAAAPGGLNNYGYQVPVAPPLSGFASYPPPAHGYQGYVNPAGFPGPTYGGLHPSYATGVGAMPPPPQYTVAVTQDMAAGARAGTPPPPYQASEGKTAG